MNNIKIIHYKFSDTYLSKLPKTHGVYIFMDKTKKIIYIGKSVNIKNRINSYLNNNLLPKTKSMISQVQYFSYILTNSEIESLLLEIRLIKNHQPKYNIISKDDKSHYFIVKTKDFYPIIKISKNIYESNILNYWGPFMSSNETKSLLYTIRLIFPYSNHKIQNRACIYNQLKLCDPCPSVIEKVKSKSDKRILQKTYFNNIKCIENILNGNIRKIINILNKDLILYKNKLNYESASVIAKKINILKTLLLPRNINIYLNNPNIITDIRNEEIILINKLIKLYFPYIKSKINRIECYDVSHFQGRFVVSSMVAFVNGSPNYKYYRRFKISKSYQNNDVASLRETAIRRLNHLNDWGKPDLILVDGGKNQTKVFFNLFNKMNIPTIGLAKRFDNIIIPISKSGNVIFKEVEITDKKVIFLLQRLRDESHRFANKYHRFLYNKQFSNKST